MQAERTKVRPEKESMLAELRERIEGSAYVYLADYKGLDMAKTTDLRGRLRKAGSRMQVVRNTLLRRAAEASGRDEVGQGGLEGPTAVVVGTGDPVEVAKVIVDFAREHDKPAIKGGSLDGRALSVAQVMELAHLPPLPVLQGLFVGTLAAPMSGLVGVFQQKMASIVYVLKAVQEKKEQPAQG